MRSALLLFIILILKFNSFAQSTTKWFPAGLNIQPFTAHFLEPKAGFQYLFDLDKVRIDIGTSRDVVKLVWIFSLIPEHVQKLILNSLSKQ